MKKGPKDPQDRRKSRRRPIIESFSLNTVIPKWGMHLLPLLDVSETGIGFQVDQHLKGFASPVEIGTTLDIRVYLNKSLYLPVKVKIVRFENKDESRLVGAEFLETTSAGYKGLMMFLSMLDNISELVQFDEA